MQGIDDIRLSFGGGTLTILNVILAVLMFGVALGMRPRDFARVARDPRGALVGLLAQFLLLPAATTAIAILLDPPPSVALGMILVATCPGGNVSNFLTFLARGNTALSVGMTAVSSVAAVVLTPLNLSFWASLDADTAALLEDVGLQPSQILVTVLFVLALPVLAGMGVGARLPDLAARIERPLRRVCVVIFLGFVAAAFAANAEHLSSDLAPLIGIVIAHNATALALGYGASRLIRVPRRDARAVSIEVGIQNSALALVLIFNFFGGLGGMALTAALWGIWHLVAGLSLALWWASRTGEAEIA